MKDAFPWRRSIAQAALAVTLIAFCGTGFAAKGGDPGPPVGGETGNNLSTPGILTESSVNVDAKWSVTDTPVLGEQFSYGCPGEEVWEEFKYPNTSCVDHLMEPTVYYTPEQCVAVGGPCEDKEVSRIYWQKEPLNEWWATDDGREPDSIPVAYVDWGDALEAVSWTERSVVRVETQPWSSTIPGYNPTTACADAAAAVPGDPEVLCKVGFQMWHVSGQGITEHWGVRATDVDETVSFNYDSPFQIIKTTNARLNVAKMVEASATCSMPGGNPGDEPPAVGDWTGSGWEGTCEVYDDPYTVETSVGGKYVYGYNLRMNEILPSEECGDTWLKTGFYRLTFYAPDDVDFTGHSEATPIPNVAPPSVPADIRTLPRTVFNTVVVPPEEPEEPEPAIEPESDEEDPDADDRLYRPVIDPINNLTYLDICIIAKSQGGGGGGGGGKGGGRGGGTGGGKGSGKGGGKP